MIRRPIRTHRNFPALTSALKVQCVRPIILAASSIFSSGSSCRLLDCSALDASESIAPLRQLGIYGTSCKVFNRGPPGKRARLGSDTTIDFQVGANSKVIAGFAMTPAGRETDRAARRPPVAGVEIRISAAWCPTWRCSRQLGTMPSFSRHSASNGLSTQAFPYDLFGTEETPLLSE
jgi:hypothetical protein